MADWKTTTDGDLVIEGGDLVIASESEALDKKIEFLIRMGLFDYAPAPDAGAGLDLFRGNPNNAETAGAVERAAVRALLADGTIPPDSITVRAVPLGPHTLTLYIWVVPRFTGIVDPVRKSFDIDLDTGDITTITGETR
jgi:hypothetical protein